MTTQAKIRNLVLNINQQINAINESDVLTDTSELVDGLNELAAIPCDDFQLVREKARILLNMTDLDSNPEDKWILERFFDEPDLSSAGYVLTLCLDEHFKNECVEMVNFAKSIYSDVKHLANHIHFKSKAIQSIPSELDITVLDGFIGDTEPADFAGWIHATRCPEWCQDFNNALQDCLVVGAIANES